MWGGRNKLGTTDIEITNVSPSLRPLMYMLPMHAATLSALLQKKLCNTDIVRSVLILVSFPSSIIGNAVELDS